MKNHDIKHITENLNFGIATILSEISNPDFFMDSSIDLITVEIPILINSKKRIKLEFFMVILNLITDDIITSLSTTCYLELLSSELLSELAKRVNLLPKRMFECSQQ